MEKTLKTIQTFAKVGKIIANIIFIFSINVKTDYLSLSSYLVAGIFMEMRTSTNPMPNKTGRGIRLTLIHVAFAKGKIELNTPIKPRPKIAALLPKIS